MIKRRYLELIVPLSTFIVLTTVVYILYLSSVKEHYSVIEQQLTDTGRLLSKEFKNIIKSDIDRLKNLRDRLEKSNGDYFSRWENDAYLIIDQNSSFKFIEWIDSSMIIKKIVPKKGNEAALNLDISKLDYRRDDWITNTKLNKINMTSWLKLTQSGRSFLVDVPVYYNHNFQGTITAGMNFEDSFNHLVDYLEDQYSVELYDNKGSLFFKTNTDIKLKNSRNIEYENKLTLDNVGNREWIIKVFPSNKLILAKSRRVNNIALIIGIILSLFTSLLTYFYLRAKKSTRLARLTNLALKKANETLNSERVRAEKASQAKTDFLSNMSHEIRTPLHAIVGFIELLKTSKLNKTNLEYLHLMEMSSNNLLTIVNDILDFEKIESGKIELSKDIFSPSLKIKELINVNQHIFSQKGLFLNSNFKNTKDLNVVGDESKFLQVTNNILKNALKFTDSGGVTVSYSESFEKNNSLKVTISIKDTGIGIPKDKLDSIFERFTQIENSIKKQYEGSGLGLAISKIFINLMDGDISVESKLNSGSEFQFHVVFPLAQNQISIKPSDNDNTVDYSKLNTLIVDDNKVNIIVLKKFLSDLGILADVAHNGKVALDMSRKKDYHLIFMDIHMPEMDGWEATREIRKNNKDVIIFGISANVTTDAINQSVSTGMDNYLTKPFKKSHLQQLLYYHFRS